MDTETTLHDKIEVATILGTIQATLTDFGYLRKDGKQNTEERLLGVSLQALWIILLSIEERKTTRDTTRYEKQSCYNK